mmetsp:Transcript_17084/g.19653  ORF Transcript_17084/g.19653 Transcript_17084/m.19653 type:complete len:160 (+) Transcript_17084:41-520(+)
MMILNQAVRAFTRKGLLLLRTNIFHRQKIASTFTHSTAIDKADDDDIATTSSRSIHIDTSLLFDLDAICSYDYETDDESDDESDSDCDDSSCIFAPPPVQFICVPIDFNHADALLSQASAQDISSNNIKRNFLLNRRDWDNHTIASNPDDDVFNTRIII